MITTLLTVFGTFVTTIITFLIARMNLNSERQKYYEDKISDILERQSREIKELKDEIEKLVQENMELRKQLGGVIHHDENYISSTEK